MQRSSVLGRETTLVGFRAAMQSSETSLSERINGVSRSNYAGEHITVGGQKRLLHDVDLSRDCSDSEDSSEPPKKTAPPNGKKTKGRVKIKMEFIDNKLRRYTTFSKRKTGIMKKAYELSTLTGTQVMLLVASETGHVYTFATRKLQPMITSEAGKALIQTCLNSPDPLLGTGSLVPDQRMSATGFEETELTYTVGDESDKDNPGGHLIYSGENSPTHENIAVNVSSAVTATLVSNLPLFTSTAPAVSTSTTTASSQKTSVASVPTISMQIPQATGFTTILTPNGTLATGATLQIGALSQANTGQSSNNQATGSTQNFYKIPQSPIVSIPGVVNSQSKNSGSTISTPNAVTVVPATQQNLSLVSGNMVIPASTSSTVGTVMYHTAQGVVYATPTTLPEGVIFNLGQQEHGNAPQQFITIPVPVSLTPSQQQKFLQSQLENVGKVSGERLSSSDLAAIKKEKGRK